jgi:RNA polymerase sigma-32 factor
MIRFRTNSEPRRDADRKPVGIFGLVSKFPFLSREEELALCRRWRASRDAEAGHKLLTSHLRLVVKTALTYSGYGLPVHELIGEGNLGILAALSRFDPDLGVRLATYALWWIRAAMQSYILANWSLVSIGTSAQQKRLFFNLSRFESRIQVAPGEDISLEQATKLGVALGVPKHAVISMHHRLGGRDYSLDAAVRHGEAPPFQFQLVDMTASQEDRIAKREEKAARRVALLSALRALDGQQRHILIERRLKQKPASRRELAKCYKISAERVRQIEMNALRKMRSVINQQSGVHPTTKTAGQRAER